MLALGQAANNYKTIQVKFTRMVYDKESDLVMVNLLEYCRCGVNSHRAWCAGRQIRDMALNPTSQGKAFDSLKRACRDGGTVSVLARYQIPLHKTCI